jgi:WD40 repeat protein
MPETRLKREASGPENEIASDRDQQISAFSMRMVEQICSAMSASGVVIAVRDSEGVRCLASAGDAPPVGSRLQPDSAFTRECLETGEVVMCDDAENDSRILPSVAKSLHLRSALAVPIQTQGSIVGVVEVFSSQPSGIHPTDVTTLKEFANLIGPIIAPESVPSAQPGLDGYALLSAHTETPSPAEERRGGGPQSVSTGWFPVPRAVVKADSEISRGESSQAEPRLPQQGPVDSPRPPIQGSSASCSAVPSTFRRGGNSSIARRRLAGAVPNIFLPFAGKTTTARIWRARAACLSYLALLFFLFLIMFGTSRPMTIKTSPSSAVPVASGRARHDEARTGPAKTQVRETGSAQESKGSDRSLRAGVPLSTEAGNSAAAGSLRLPAVPLEKDTAIASSVSPEQADAAAALPRDSKLAGAVGSEEGIASSPSPEPFIETARVQPLELMEPARAAFLAVTLPLAAPIKLTSTSPPGFELDRTLKGHSGWVTGLAFSSDGQRLASGSWDQTVKFWDVPTGQELRAVGGNLGKAKEVQALAFSRDGRWLATENSSNAVTLWDATTGRQVRTLPSDKPLGPQGSSWVYSIAFSPDGRWLASGVDDKTVRLWDVTTGRAVRDLTALRRSVIYAAFSPDGRWLASGNDDKSIRIWDVSTGQEIRTLSGHKKLIYAVAFSPNGRWLASASADKSIKLWDITTGREVRTLAGHQKLVTSLAFSPDGRWLASGSWDKTIKIWNVETGREVQTLGGHDHSVYAVAFDSRGRWLASGSEDGTISLWRLNETGDQTTLR